MEYDFHSIPENQIIRSIDAGKFRIFKPLKIYISLFCTVSWKYLAIFKDRKKTNFGLFNYICDTSFHLF